MEKLLKQAVLKAMTRRGLKSRTVFCRICDEDYNDLANICKAEGGSVSDLLRTAIKDLIKRSRENPDDVLPRILKLTFDIEKLSKDIEQLRALTIAACKDRTDHAALSIAHELLSSER